MKANEAPEKIYLNKHPFTGELHDKWLQNKWDDSDIEYIRTDAFIEKACEWVEENIEKFVSVDGEYTIYYDDMRKNLIEYMEGE